MKKRYFVLYALVLLGIICGCAYADVPVDEANFPDENFRAYVSGRFDINGDDILSEEEIIDANSIIVPNMNIQSLKGIEHFTELTTLYCYNNQLTELDVRSNINLQRLSCFTNKITALDVTHNILH